MSIKIKQVDIHKIEDAQTKIARDAIISIVGEDVYKSHFHKTNLTMLLEDNPGTRLAMIYFLNFLESVDIRVATKAKHGMCIAMLDALPHDENTISLKESDLPMVMHIFLDMIPLDISPYDFEKEDTVFYNMNKTYGDGFTFGMSIVDDKGKSIGSPKVNILKILPEWPRGTIPLKKKLMISSPEFKNVIRHPKLKVEYIKEQTRTKAGKPNWIRPVAFSDKERPKDLERNTFLGSILYQGCRPLKETLMVNYELMMGEFEVLEECFKSGEMRHHQHPFDKLNFLCLNLVNYLMKEYGCTIEMDEDFVLIRSLRRGDEDKKKIVQAFRDSVKKAKDMVSMVYAGFVSKMG